MDVNQIVRNLPTEPGVYQFYDKNNDLLYIGKAKNLKNRVSSYFTKGRTDSFKTKKLATQVHNIKHIVVETEADALFLENNLIKKYQPKYNILLKDDKTFPWICIKKEPFPRVFSTRNRVQDGSEYFGPYTSALMVRTLLDLIKQLYTIRNCKFNLTKENIEQGKFKPCLEYHLGNCKAPCTNSQTEEDYAQSVSQIRQVLKGNLQEVQDYLFKLMKDYASKQKFEEAEIIKQKIELLKKYRSKSTIVNPKINNVEVYSFIEEDNYSYVNFLSILNGAIVQSYTVELIRKLEETKEELLVFAMIDIREKVMSSSKEVIVPFEITPFNDIDFVIPKRGDKKNLLELSERNARKYAQQKRLLRLENKNRNKKSTLLNTVQADLRLKELPIHIECFDNSNIQGTSPVAACVVFRDGKPCKNDYRHYHIKTVTGANDFASMEEIIYRRYRRLLEEEQSLPQLIVIDGGKGQLGAAVKSLKELEVYGKIAVLGIAKRLEELYFPGDSVPLYLDKNSQTLKLIQHLRNEAHRFGITFHRKIRSKAMLKNSLEEIDGVGQKTITKLLKEFGSIEGMKSKTVEELSNVVSEKIAHRIHQKLNQQGHNFRNS